MSTISTRPAELEPTVVESLNGQAKRMLINGDWVESSTGRTFETIDPSNGRVLANVAEADAADVDRAVDAARAAFEHWGQTSPQFRAGLLLRIAELIEAHATELAQLETLDVGKPIFEATNVDVPVAVQTFRYYAGWPSTIYGETNPSDPAFFSYTLREPVGVCGQIIPWNFPLLLAAWKLAPALACGNTVVLKPSAQAPLTSLRLGELLHEAGLPAGVVNVVPGRGATAGAAIAAHPGVDKVAFTGSTEVGRTILAASAGNLKRVSLELGGKSPNIVFADADVDEALMGVLAGVFFNQGQVCFAGSRLFVEEPLYEEFTEKLAAYAGQIKLGPPLDPDTRMGPLVSEQQFGRVTDYLRIGHDEGAHARIGGGTARQGPLANGYFVQPTLFTGVSNDMRIAQEEIFGPVVSAIPFRDEADAVLQGNATMYGLAAGVWTKDVSRAHRLARALKAGTVWVNCYGVIDPASPFGGYKQSGFGRELGRHSIELYTQVKQVWLKV